jgi:putative copper resistance protein D
VTSLTAAIAACRFLDDAALVLLWGGFAYLAMLVPAALRRPLADRLVPMGKIAAIVVIAATILRLPLESAKIGNGWADALNPAVLWPVLTTTSIGTAWQLQAVTALLVVAALFGPRGRAIPVMAAAAAGLGLIALTFSGHAVMAQGTTRMLQQINDSLHLLAAGGWLGALVPLIWVLKYLGDPAYGPHAMVALMRFSVAGHFAVALTVLTGLTNTLLIVGGLPINWAAPYQAMLSAKIALVLVMIALATVNRYRYTPRLSADGTALAALRRGAMVEVLVGAVVIALVATFGLFDPA